VLRPVTLADFATVDALREYLADLRKEPETGP
jgi:hypothetical protein